MSHLQTIRDALRSWRGGNACPWAWQPSHSWFTLRVTKEGMAGNLHLLCGDCEHVEFENRILDIDLELDEIAAPERTRGGWRSTAGIRVVDRDRLLVICGLVEIRHDVPPLF
jgi:hypothetical protein